MIHQDVNPFIPTAEAHAPPVQLLGEEPEESETSDKSPRLYLEGVRRNYATLLGITATLETVDASSDHRRNLGEVVARFVEQIVWADQRVAVSEVEAISNLISLDSEHAGSLAECLREPCGDIVSLSELPAFLRSCFLYDRALAAQAVDAFESLGLALMASDREISEEELNLIQSVLASWRKNAEAVQAE
jgi:hypothetical protein